MEEWICSVVEEAEEETTKCRTVSMVDAVAIDRICVLKYS